MKVAIAVPDKETYIKMFNKFKKLEYKRANHVYHNLHDVYRMLIKNSDDGIIYFWYDDTYCNLISTKGNNSKWYKTYYVTSCIPEKAPSDFKLFDYLDFLIENSKLEEIQSE